MHTFKEQTGYSIGKLSLHKTSAARKRTDPIRETDHGCTVMNVEFEELFHLSTRAYKKCFGESPRDLRQSTLIQ